MTMLLKIGESLDQTKNTGDTGTAAGEKLGWRHVPQVPHQRTSAWLQPEITVVLVVRVP